MTYLEQEKSRAAAWKSTTSTLPEQARRPASYIGKDGHPLGRAVDSCLPVEFAGHNLLPGVREPALALFRELGIPWHAGVGDGPSNHLVSSQVQCVNALMSMVDDPGRIVRAFAGLLGTVEVLPIEPGRYLTFEYIGPTDFFGEARGRDRTRGAHCTSVDAAFVHRTTDGVIELVMLEWKYAESYKRLRGPDAARDRERFARYGRAVADPDGPVRGDVLPFEMLLDEPFYQLVRQQLLAHELEKIRAEGATRVRVVHLMPAGNSEYRSSLPRAEHQSLGNNVSQVWQQVLRHTDRFVSIDSGLFLDQDITSREYVLRYADDVVHDLPALLDELGIDDPDGIDDALMFHGEVLLSPGGIELQIGEQASGYHYPFTVTELHALSAELDPDDSTANPSVHPIGGVPATTSLSTPEPASRAAFINRFGRDAIPVEVTGDYANSISSTVLRLILDGQRTVAIGSDAPAHDQACALLDLLDLHFAQAPVGGQQPTVNDQVTVIVGRDPSQPDRADEAISALRTLRSHLSHAPTVRLLVWNGHDATYDEQNGAGIDYATSEKAGDYRSLLDAVATEPPRTLRQVVDGLGIDGLRAYPMLRANPWWSLRLEGLEIGRFRDDTDGSWLGVGSQGKDGDGFARTTWLATLYDLLPHGVVGTTSLPVSSIGTDAARHLVAAFSDDLHDAARVKGRQNEHALESRILRGDCVVHLSDGTALEVLNPDPVVNWGSQFPTRWGEKSSHARYLDALLRIGRTPYAVEIKVESQGVGKYYRHAIAQAVLYRYFIRTAHPTHGWFEDRGLEATACQAVVVVPAPTTATGRGWVNRHRQLAQHLDVEFLEVDTEKAYA